MNKKTPRRGKKYPVRIPVAPPTEIHKDRKRYNRKRKHKKLWEETKDLTYE